MPSGTSFRVSKRFVGKLAALSIFASATWAAADEPSRLGRLFRFGSGSSNASSVNRPSATLTQPALEPSAQPSQAPSPFPLNETAPSILEPIGPPSSAVSAPNQPRNQPRPTPGRGITTADPVVTRIALGRSTDGRQFGMFLQVYEDGTVIDSEGVHNLGHEAVRPIVESIKTGENFRVRGHCGNASTDFIENVQMVVYDRRFSTLRAHSLSFSGNSQGCDHSVKHLQVLLDTLQAKLSEPTRPLAPQPEAPESTAAPQPPLPVIVGPN